MAINTFFLRVSACCNLDCDYCYVFKHRDKAWKNYPLIIDNETVELFAKRIKEYVDNHPELNEINIVFHGGEPLMCGSKKIEDFVMLIRSIVGNKIPVYFSLQTNGTLIKEDFIKFCSENQVGISVSIDGPAGIHNKHRPYKNKKNTHEDVFENIMLLKRYPNVFEGVIGVIDPTFEPDEIFSFFRDYAIYNIDLLLPDSTYQDPPVGRIEDKLLYERWLIKAFDVWFEKYPELHFRTFETLLQSILGIDTALDAFGGGDLNYLTVETDGSYHTSDILKSTYENASFTGFFLSDATIDEVLKSAKVIEYNSLLDKSRLPVECINCEFIEQCGGGSLPHRYSVENQFDNPTVYCKEMKAIISYARSKLFNAIENE